MGIEEVDCFNDDMLLKGFEVLVLFVSLIRLEDFGRGYEVGDIGRWGVEMGIDLFEKF